MSRARARMILALGLSLGAALLVIHSAAAPPDEDQPEKLTTQRAAGVQEARTRAELLHETLHSTLHAVHRDYFREDEAMTIPSRSLERVFVDIERNCDVKLRWLAVNAQAMSIEHEPADDFEREAVRALRSGKDSYERVEDGDYRRAAPITLFSQCLRCHLPNRMSAEARFAGLTIRMPLAAP